MSTLAATPQFYTPDDLAAKLAADFAMRGISATIEVGEWDPELHRGESRVIIGYAKGKVSEPSGHYQPGAMWVAPAAGYASGLARAMLDDAQRFAFIVHAPAVGSAEGAAAAARRATDQLKRATFAALKRAMQGPFREPADVTWPQAPVALPDGYPAWTYGSRCDFELVFASPILDDAEGVIPVTSVSTSTSFTFLDGTNTQAETNTGAT